MKTKRLLLMGVAAVAALSSCGEKDLYNPNYAKELQEAKYAENFEKKFGTVPSTYSWDVSTGVACWQELTSRAGETITDADIKKSTTYYEVQQPTLDYMNGKLKESQNNKSLGKPFTMSLPNNEFTIVPLYQGQAGMEWELWIGMGNVTKKLWSKSEGMQKCNVTYKRDKTTDPWKETSRTDWANLGVSDNTLTSSKYYREKEMKTSTTSEGSALAKVVTNGAVQAKSITVDLTRYAGQQIYFYLHVTKGSSSYADTGKNQTSLDGMIVALNECPLPTNLPEGTQSLIIGCEDANKGGSDWDMNDVVFLIYGKPYVPGVVEIVDGKQELVVSKRYMFEDLGSTDDFDFNDLVVDLIDTQVYKIVKENGIEKERTLDSHTQQAIIRHLGGTIPLQLHIGGKSVWSCDGKGFQTSPDEEISLDENPWIPTNNNVSLTAKSQTSDYNVEFPAVGHPAPYVIATDITVPWKAERESITKEWFDGLKK